MKRTIFVLLILSLSAATAWAQCRQAPAAPLHFQTGRTTAVVKGQLNAGGDACYKLRARANQQMTVHVTSPKNDIHFNIFPPGQAQTLASETDDWRDILPATGDYVIALYPTKPKQGDTYTLEVSISALPQTHTDSQPPPPPSAQPTPAATSDADYTFDAGEGFYLFDGKPPAGFEGFQGFEFPGVLLKLSADKSHVVSVSQTPTAQLDFKGGRVVKAKQVNFNDDQISFETVVVRGVSYQFNGRFSKGKDDKEQLLNAELKGRITKFLNGKKVAEAQMSFYQVVGG